MSNLSRLLVLLLCPVALVAQEPSAPDSLKPIRSALPSPLKIGAMILLSTGADLTFRHLAQSSRSSGSNAIAKAGDAFGDPLYVAPALAAGYLLAQVNHRGDIATTVWRAGKSALVATAITRLVKIGVGRRRPFPQDDMDAFRPLSSLDGSFPSGHTTLAFAVATTMGDASGSKWLRAAWYGAAVTTGLARLNDDQHWFSDVVAGAVVGHLTARLMATHSQRLIFSVAPHGVRASISF